MQTRRAEVCREIPADFVDAPLQDAELTGIPKARDRRYQSSERTDHRRHRRHDVHASILSRRRAHVKDYT